VKRAAEVIVVGAGASGLRLAGILGRAGISAVVLEGRDRAGGRLLSVDPGIDLGATWFWQNENDVREVIAECGLESFPQYASGNMMYQIPGSVQELDGNPLDQQAWRIKGGTQGLAIGLAQILPAGTLQLSSKVTELQFDEGVTVTTHRGVWKANHVVLALPPATALANISFTPRLPANLINVAKSTPVWMGAVTKVVAIYDSPFWRARGLAGSAMSHVGPLREIHDVSDQNGSFGALFGFSRERITEGAVAAQLAELFGAEAKTPRSILIKDWSASEFTSPPSVFQLNDYQLFGSKVLRAPHFDGRLFFASTESATDSPGHIQGAFSAARRTANSIIELTKSRALQVSNGK
jgi:monoamine oxidase